jgi:hypothetical protein
MKRERVLQRCEVGNTTSWLRNWMTVISDTTREDKRSEREGRAGEILEAERQDSEHEIRQSRTDRVEEDERRDSAFEGKGLEF